MQQLTGKQVDDSVRQNHSLQAPARPSVDRHGVKITDQPNEENSQPKKQQNPSATKPSPAFPSVIPLSFHRLKLDEPPKGRPEADWKMIGTVHFGKIRHNAMNLTVYQEPKTGKYMPSQYDGILHAGDTDYLFRDLSASVIKPNYPACDETCLFERFFPGQHRYELIGSLAMFANGPGLKVFVIYDTRQHRLLSFEDWGKPEFIDLDGDGRDEFIVQFQGLHLHFPDITIYQVKRDQLEICPSILHLAGLTSFQNSAVLLDKKKPPVIRLASIRADADFSDYTVQQGKLKKITGNSNVSLGK